MDSQHIELARRAVHLLRAALADGEPFSRPIILSSTREEDSLLGRAPTRAELTAARRAGHSDATSGQGSQLGRAKLAVAYG
jgi:hypothetical protein